MLSVDRFYDKDKLGCMQKSCHENRFVHGETHENESRLVHEETVMKIKEGLYMGKLSRK